jgi:hypothetical protein
MKYIESAHENYVCKWAAVFAYLHNNPPKLGAMSLLAVKLLVIW